MSKVSVDATALATLLARAKENPRLASLVKAVEATVRKVAEPRKPVVKVAVVPQEETLFDRVSGTAEVNYAVTESSIRLPE